MSTFSVKINGKNRQVDADPAAPLLWVLRDHLDMPGTKYGCGMAQCGACTVHLSGTAVHCIKTRANGSIINRSSLNWKSGFEAGGPGIAGTGID